MRSRPSDVGRQAPASSALGVRAVERRLRRVLTPAEIVFAAAVALLAVAVGRPLLVVLPTIWMLVQLACMTRDGYGRGILSRRYTLMRGYLALPLALGLALSHAPGLTVPSVLVTLGSLTVLSLSVRVVLSTARMRRRLHSDAKVRIVAVGSPVQLERALVRFQQDPKVELVGVCIDPDRAEYAAGRLASTPLIDLEELPDEVGHRQVDQVRVLPGGIDDSQLEALAWRVEQTSAELVLETSLVNVIRERMSPTTLGGAGIVVRSLRASATVRRVRSVLDRLVAAALLVPAAPVLLACVALIRIESRGPAVFKQVRIGQGGRPFTILKLRTMRVDAEAQLQELLARNEYAGGLLFKMKEDPRVTRVGRVLRRASLDELPQLFNVVRGEMSLVGPRPALPREVEAYDRRAFRRLAVKPGITGLWQVSGRSGLNSQEGVRLDLDYVDNWTPVRDLRILGRTFSAVLGREGAY